MHDRKPQPRPARLRGEERLEQSLPRIGRNAGSGIVDGEEDLTSVDSHVYAYASTGGRGVQGIERKVHQRLAKELGIGRRLRKPPGDRMLQHDPSLIGFSGQKADHRFHGGSSIHAGDVQLARPRELREVLMNPSIASEQKLKVLDAIAGRIGMFPQVRNFVAVIVAHQRLLELDEILAEYRTIADEQFHMAEADVTSAHPLNNQDRAELEAQIAKLAGGRVRATYHQDPALLGGAVVRIGSTIYDGSIRAQLQQLKQRLVSA